MKTETNQKAKEATKRIAFDWVLIVLTIETMVNYLFDYWSLIAPYLGEHEALIRIHAFVIRLAIIGWRFYRANKKPAN